MGRKKEKEIDKKTRQGIEVGGLSIQMLPQKPAQGQAGKEEI